MPEHDKAARAACAYCGQPIEGGRADKLFCKPACKIASHNLDIKRGQELLAYAQVWRGGKNARSPEAKELARYAFAEMCHLIDRYNGEDRRAGRRQELVIARRFERKERVVDREPRPAMESPSLSFGQQRRIEPLAG